MKKLLIVLAILMSITGYSQSWVTDSDIHSKISSQSQFDDGHSIVVIEFWAEFNKDNAFKEWEKIQSVEYYRCDVAKSPKSKKEFRIRMAPTIIIFVDGVKVETFKAGLDLLCPVELPELKQAIQQAQKSSQF
tara:strand:+ start:2451 stop:2849 length:399 start_codon:yes stop_codon:yes gene_type:complete